MYLILNSTNRIVDISSQAQFVRRQANKVIVGCTQDKADAIYSANTDTFYPLDPIGYIGDGYTLREVEAVPDEVVAGYYFYHADEFYTTEDELSKLVLARAEADVLPAASVTFVHLAESGAFDATTIAEHSVMFAPYVPAIPYTAGQIRIDPADGILYKCITSHGAEHASDAPRTKNNLWERIADPGDEWPEWFPASGVFDQWMKGSKCTHKSVRYTSNVDNNVWEPGTTGAPWTEVA